MRGCDDRLLMLVCELANTGRRLGHRVVLEAAGLLSG